MEALLVFNLGLFKISAGSSGQRFGGIIVVRSIQNLPELVERAVTRHDTSIRQLSFKAQEEGFRLAGTTFGHFRAGTYKSVPSDEMSREIAWLAGVSEGVGFTAAGQPAPGPPLADELPPGVENPSPKSRKVAFDMVRVLVDLDAGNHDSQDKPQTNPPEHRALRAVGSSSDAVQNRRTSPRAASSNSTAPKPINTRPRQLNL